MLKDFVVEQSSTPGDSVTISLSGAITGRVAFSDVFANGAEVFYVIEDGSEWEVGEGSLNHGTPDTLDRDTVLANSSGTTDRIDFVGAVYVYNSIPAARAVNLNDFNPTFGTREMDYTIPGGVMRQSGSVEVTTDGSGGATINFPATFGDTNPTVVVSNGNATLTQTPVYLVGQNDSAFVVVCPGRLSGTYRVNWTAEGVA